MPRLRRADLDGEDHHVIVKGHNGDPIISGPAEADELMARIGEGLRYAGLVVLAYALLTNHLHLFVRGLIAAVSQAMRRALGPYAQRRNHRLDRKGSMFTGRFWSRPIESEAHAQNAVPYIIFNPRGAGLVRTVEGLRDYRWCSYGPSLHDEPSPLPMDVEGALWLFARDPEHARRMIRHQLDAREERWKADRQMETLDSIIRVVAMEQGLPEDLVRDGLRGRWWDDARREVVFRARQRLNEPASTLAAALGVSKQTIYRLLSQTDSHPDLVRMRQVRTRRVG